MIERASDKELRFLNLILQKISKGDSVDLQSFETEKDSNFLIGTADYWEEKQYIKDFEIEIAESEEYFGYPNGWITVKFVVTNRDFFESEVSKLQEENPKREQPILRRQTTELIARALGEMMTGTDLQQFLLDQGVDGDLVIYPNTKWRMAHDALNYLCASARQDDFEKVQKVLRESLHPIFHTSDIEKSRKFEDQINSWVGFDGYRFTDGILSKIQTTTEGKPPSDINKEALLGQVKKIEELLDQDKKKLDVATKEMIKRIETFWLQSKMVLDAIEDCSSRIATGAQIINLPDLDVPKLLKEDLLKSLHASGVLDYLKDESPFIVSTREWRRFLQGQSVIVKNVEEINTFSTSIQTFLGDLQEKQKALSGIIPDLPGTPIYNLPTVDHLALMTNPVVTQTEVIARNGQREERQSREANRIRKLMGKSVELYATEEFLRHSEYLDGEKHHIVLHYFDDLCFEERRRQMAELFFSQLRDKGCFTDFERVKGGFYRFSNLEFQKLSEVRQSKLERLNDEDRTPKFPHKIPRGTRWNHVTIVFLNGSTVEMTVKGKKHTATFLELGLIGKGMKPSEAWTFLKVLSQQNGEISISDKIAKKSYKKQKEILSDFLENYFHIDFDPFDPYELANSYRIKLNLYWKGVTEPPDESGKVDIDDEVLDPAEEDTWDLQKELKEMAPDDGLDYESLNGMVI